MNPRIVSASVRAASASVRSRRAATSSAVVSSFVGEDLSGGGGAAGDLVEQRGGGAAVGALVAVLGGEVGADERFEPGAIGGLGAEALALSSQLVGEDVGDEILLGGEVGVEGAVGQAGVGHHGGHAGAVDAVFFEAPSGRFEDALSGGLLVPLVRMATSSNVSIVSAHCITAILVYYDRNAIERRRRHGSRNTTRSTCDGSVGGDR